MGKERERETKTMKLCAVMLYLIEQFIFQVCVWVCGCVSACACVWVRSCMRVRARTCICACASTLCVASARQDRNYRSPSSYSFYLQFRAFYVPSRPLQLEARPLVLHVPQYLRDVVAGPGRLPSDRRLILLRHLTAATEEHPGASLLVHDRAKRVLRPGKGSATLSAGRPAAPQQLDVSVMSVKSSSALAGITEPIGPSASQPRRSANQRLMRVNTPFGLERSVLMDSGAPVTIVIFMGCYCSVVGLHKCSILCIKRFE